MTEPTAPGQEDRLLRILELRRAYIHSLPEKLEAIGGLWDRSIHVAWSQELLTELQGRIHTLRGSGATFGLEAVADIARRVEEALTGFRGQAPDPAGREGVTRLVAELATAIRQATGTNPGASADPGADPFAAEAERLLSVPPTAPAAGRRRLIYLAEDDREPAVLLSLYLGQQGYEVRIFTTPAALVAACADQSPDAVIADIVFPGDDDAGLDAMARLGPQGPGRPVLIFASARVDLAARLKAVRMGADAYLMKPIDLGALTARLEELLADPAADPYRVLVVDDEPELAQLYATVLGQAGVRCEVLTDAEQIMRPLMAFRPELILADLHMPGLDGFELARIVRQEDAFLNTPIFFLSSDTRDANTIESISVGADHFLHKPIAPELLIGVVTSRVRRVRGINRRLEYLAQRDPVSGVYNRAFFGQALQQALDSTTDAPGALVCCLIDNYLSFRDTHSDGDLHAFIAQISGAIRSRMATGDLIGVYNDCSLLVFLRRTDEAALRRFAEGVCRAVAECNPEMGGRRVRPSCSVGMQRVRTQGVQPLIAAAAAAAMRAHAAGGNRVQWDEETQVVEERQEQERRFLAILTERNQDWGRLSLAYQPMVGLGHEAQVFHEVLLRVEDNRGGQYPVAEVVATAVRHGLTARLDRWVVGLALMALAKGRMRQGQHVLFVKISAESVDNEALFETLEARLAKTGVGPRLVFLFPQTAIWTNLDLLVRRARALKALGACSGIERFGRTASDVQVLRWAPIDYIKLDRSLTRGLERDPALQARFKAILDEAHARNVRVIAGFVEEPATLSYLWTTGVDLIQGDLVQPAAGEEMVYEAITMEGQ